MFKLLMNPLQQKNCLIIAMIQTKENDRQQKKQINSEFNLKSKELVFLQQISNNYRHVFKKFRKQMQIINYFTSKY
ncbi:15387_t:CDS:2 [Cetraspora pellucida]|uniref:15387_t:CDS:1 n=1 Tax=Cetraspora pellucida TaxID=1433469 RepID=A0ACA9KN28_9GLOM|nr:15387_t:CDS:2 [Cetraspora pellucida]